MDQGLVSIIVPMHNAERYIGQALGSLLRERGIPMEVIVVDDRSTDNSRERVISTGDERIRIVEGNGIGIAGCMNVGLANARGSIIMRCDADDLFPKERIIRQVTWLTSHSEYDGLCGAFSTIDSKGNFVADLQCGTDELDITHELSGGIIRTHLCTFAIRSALIAKVGGFRDYFETGEDADFQLRLGEAGRIFYIPERYYVYRLHPASITHTQHTVLREHLAQTAVEFQRQRLTLGLDDLQRGCPPQRPSITNSPIKSASEHVQGILLGHAWIEYQNGNNYRALKTALRAAFARPLEVIVWRSLFVLTFRIACRSERPALVRSDQRDDQLPPANS